ncbi:alpha/beta fold hydrolase [Synechococcus elongatus]|uniref:alpha/beta fold hydrolase n=1 Tax=Synechococcus elongatus TaxID=32046 RepID=UPI000F7DBD58|nr:alpha/beta fold hydrolase [Synechococcus elongatus]
MLSSIDAVWISVSPALQMFDRPLLQTLAQSTAIAHWEYLQDPDEAASLDTALVLLHDYLKSYDRPLHLLGHGTGGLLGLLYAHHYPEHVRSLTILSVGVDPAVNWQSYYYNQRRDRLEDQQILLQKISDRLLGCRKTSPTVTHALKQDLYESLSLHSLLQSASFPPVAVKVPLLVCGSADDIIISQEQIKAWRQHLYHALSRMWICLSGRHFFHCIYPEQVSQQITQFWNQLAVFA